jgi:hypothetical protein
MAFDEAYVPPDRRRSLRVKYQVPAQVTAWKRGKVGEPLDVRIEDFSPTGAGLYHTEQLPVGSQWLLNVPRPEHGDLIVLLTVVRSKQQEDGTWLVGMELSSVLDRSVMNQFVDTLNNNNGPRRVTSKRTRRLLMILGIFGIAFALILS